MAAGVLISGAVWRVQRTDRIINCLESEVCMTDYRNRMLGGANGKVRKGCRQECQERNAPSQTWHASLRPTRERRPSQEPQAGHCHRAFRSSQKGRKGPT